MERAYGTRKGFRDFEIEDSRSYKSRVKQQCPYCPKSLLHVNRHIMLAHREAYRARHAARSSYTKKIKQINPLPDYSHHREYESSKYPDVYMHSRLEQQQQQQSSRMVAPEPKSIDSIGHHDVHDMEEEKPRLHGGRTEDPIKCTRCDTFMAPKLHNILEHQKHCHGAPGAPSYPQSSSIPSTRESYLMSRGYPNPSSSGAHLNGDDGYPGTHQKSSYAVHPTSLTFTDVAIVEEFQRELMPAFTDSEVDIICKTDDTLILMGSQMAQSLKGYTKDHRLYQTMAFMRNIADVYTHFDQYAASFGLQLQVIDMFHANHLPLLDAVIKLETMSASPSNAKSKQDFFKSTLNSCVHILKGWYDACRKEIFKKEQEIGNFETSFSSYWQNGMKCEIRAPSAAAHEKGNETSALNNGPGVPGQGAKNLSEKREAKESSLSMLYNGSSQATEDSDELPCDDDCDENSGELSNGKPDDTETDTPKENFLEPAVGRGEDFESAEDQPTDKAADENATNVATKMGDNGATACENAASVSENASTTGENAVTAGDNAASASENTASQGDNPASTNDNTTLTGDNTATTSDGATLASNNTQSNNSVPSTSSTELAGSRQDRSSGEASDDVFDSTNGGLDYLGSPLGDRNEFFDSYIEDLSRSQAMACRWDQGSGSVLLSEDFFEHPIFSRQGKRGGGGSRRLLHPVSVDSYCRPGKRRYLRWSSQDTVVILDSFSKYIVQEDEGCKGQLPGMAELRQFCASHDLPSLAGLDLRQRCNALKIKVFNERKKLRERAATAPY